MHDPTPPAPREALRPAARGEAAEPGTDPDPLVTLARRHLANPAPGGGIWRLPLGRLERCLAALYHRIAENARSGRPGLRAEEWLIDNRHLIQEALAQVRRHLPRGYLRRLPRVASGRTALPRVRELAAVLAAASPGPLDVEHIERGVESYQSEIALEIGELWALPSFLRLAILEDLVAAGCRCLGLDPGTAAPSGTETDARPEPVAGAILGLRWLDGHDWRLSFERLSRVERILRRDPAGAYAGMDFSSRNRYRDVVETLARRSRYGEIQIAERVVERCGEDRSREPASRHVGYHLVGAGRGGLERELGFRPALRQRLTRCLLDRPALVYFGLLAVLALPPLAGLTMHLADHGGRARFVLAALAVVPVLGFAVIFANGLITSLVPVRRLARMNFDRGVPEACRTAVVMPVLLAGPDDVERVLERIEINFLNNGDRRIVFAILSDFADAGERTLPGDAALLERISAGVRALNRRHGSGSERGPFLLLHRERRWNAVERRWMGWERKRGKLVEFNRLLAGDGDTSYTTRIGDSAALHGVRFVITLDADTHLPPGAAKRLIATLAHPLNQPVYDPARGIVTAGYGILQPRLETDPDSTEATRFATVYAGDTRVDLYTHAVSEVYHDLFGEGSYAGKGIYDWWVFEQALAGRIPENRVLSHDLLEGLFARVGLVSDVIVLEQFPPHAIAFMRRLHRWVRGDWQLLPWLLPWAPAGTGRWRRNRLPLISRWKLFDNLRRSLQAPATLALLLAAWFGIFPGQVWVWTVAMVAMHLAPLLAEVVNLASRALADPCGLPARLRHAPAALRRPLLHGLMSLVLLAYEARTTLDAVARSLYRLAISHRDLLEWTPAAHVQRRLDRFTDSLRPWWREMWVSPALALTVAIVVATVNPSALAIAAPFALAWFAAPLLAAWSARARHRPAAPLPAAARRCLRGLARRTWSFFEQFVGPDDHWLAPDNFQEEPRPVLARRTSPTNIGLSLVSTLAAWDFGYLDPITLAARLRNSFDSLGRMERYRGHWLNWYATRDIRPLSPRYVSTVDSGNLAASLVVLAQGVREVAAAPVSWQRLLAGVLDTLDAFEDTLDQAVSGADRKRAAALYATLHAMREQVRCAPAEPDGWRIFHRSPQRHVTELGERLLEVAAESTALGEEDIGHLTAWLDELRRQFDNGRDCLDRLLPWLSAFSGPVPSATATGQAATVTEPYRSLRAAFADPPVLRELPQRCREVSLRLRAIDDTPRVRAADTRAAAGPGEADRRLCERLEDGALQAERLLRDLDELALQAERWVGEIDFSFLYDRDRHLFRIGYDVDNDRRDANHYDLLASEARLASLLAIAKGDVPMRHWLHLSRPLRRRRGRTILMSWSATLFEYLMPRLFMRVPSGSLLDRGCRAAIALHREFGARLGLPWGMSESGYYHLDEHQHYQYRAFGVPGLGFRSDLGERVVVAPYASLMALAFEPAPVLDNLDRLTRLRAIGHYGPYEAIDFGRRAKATPRRARIVRSYMSHHQGMILLALDNFLNDEAITRRFHAERRIAAISTLLHERPPPPGIALQSWKLPETIRVFQGESTPRTWPQPVRGPTPCLTRLSNGHYSVLLDAEGGGGSEWDGVALIPWQADGTVSANGHWFYVKDLDDGSVFSVTADPVGGDATGCTAEFGLHRADFQRREHGLFCRMSVAVASQHDVEARRLTLHNESNRPRRLLVAGFAELALAPAREFFRHPAFARLFVESECLTDESMLVFRRRPRGSHEKPLYLGHTVMAAPGLAYRFGWDCERGGFLSRGGDPSRPRALRGGLEGFLARAGAVLDPAIATAVEFELPPYGRAELGYLTAVSRSRRELLATLRSYRSMPRLDWIFEQARMQTGQELHLLEIDPADGDFLQTLLSAVLARRRALRGPESFLAQARCIRSLLWSRGISGDWPILLVRLRDPGDLGLVEPLLAAHTLWCGRQQRMDLVLLDEAAGGYMQPSRDRLLETIARVRSRILRKLAGTVAVVAGTELRPGERASLVAAAYAMLDTGQGSFSDQLAALSQSDREPPPVAPVRHPDWRPLPTPPLPRPGDLRFDNGLAGFSADGREYVIHLAAGALAPAPWSNVLANPGFGCLVSESGSQCTWAGNSSEWRLSPWPNDPVRDRSGETLYLRDEETGRFWTPTPRPIPGEGDYQVRHGAGRSEFRHHGHGLLQRLAVVVDPAAPVKLLRLTLTNVWPWPRRITATCYVEWVLGSLRSESAPHVIVDWDSEGSALLARNAFVVEGSEATAFLTASLPPHGLCADRREFLGRGGDVHDPAALRRIGLSGRVRAGDDPCAVYQVHLDIPAGDTVTVHFALGQGTDRVEACALARRFRDAAEAEACEQRSRRHWEQHLSALEVHTPEPAMDLLINRWLPYQVLACRLWGRSGYYQSSGAFGFRDQLQDVMALTWAAPELTREHILRAAGRQFQDGDVLHWWHEAPLRGVRTRCSDDLLWLPFAVSHYLHHTGDETILGETLPYLAGPPLQRDQTEHYAEFVPSREAGSVYEHCLRTIDRASTVGPHGLPTIGSGDWNDGFNRVSTTGRGESVWLAWFLARVCDDFAPWCERRGDPGLAAHYRSLAEEMRRAAEAEGWDGEWYRRAYYDDGSPLGSAANDECRIDLIAQAWSVLAGAPSRDRASRAMDAAWRHLVRERERLVLLLAPPFDRSRQDPGYIKGYPPGIRENGGQYTHAAAWAVWAFAMLGDGERAMTLFRLLNPILRTDNAEGMEAYRVEPYVLAGDVYGVAPHTGRGGWTWYSGAAGWLYRAGVEALLGLRRHGDELEIDPCLPEDWAGFSARLRCGKSCYEITVERRTKAEAGPLVVLDGQRLGDRRIPFRDDGGRHTVIARVPATRPPSPTTTDGQGPGLQHAPACAMLRRTSSGRD